MTPPIVIDFTPSGLGRVDFELNVMTADRTSLRPIMFKLDTGSDFTTLSCDDLKRLSYTEEQLLACKEHNRLATTGGGNIPLRYIENVSIKFGDREIQGVRVFFALGTKLRSLFGCDILKYFNYSVNNDSGELILSPTANPPPLSAGEKPIQIYAIEN